MTFDVPILCGVTTRLEDLHSVTLAELCVLHPYWVFPSFHLQTGTEVFSADVEKCWFLNMSGNLTSVREISWN